MFKYDEKKNILQDPKPLHESWFPCMHYPNPKAFCSANALNKMNAYGSAEEHHSQHQLRVDYSIHRNQYHKNNREFKHNNQQNHG